MKPLLTTMTTRFSFWNRRRRLGRIRELIRQTGVRSVLLVGVSRTSDTSENLIERGLQSAAPFVVGSGLEVPIDPWPLCVRCDGRALPFRDGAFDLVVSNAVIEHVGGEADQEHFVGEHARVGRRWIISTPNRRFPIEPHTRVLVRHWDGRWRHRQTAFSRILSLQEFRRLLPASASISGGPFTPTFLATGTGGERQPVDLRSTCPRRLPDSAE